MHTKLESTMHVFKHSNLSSCDVLNELNKKKKNLNLKNFAFGTL